MQIIHINKLTINYAGREIFRDLQWALNDRDRVGLIGPNGAGKSSLLKAIAGRITPESGHIALAKGARVGYLPQAADIPTGTTLIQAALIPPESLARAEAALSTIEAKMADPAVYGDPDALARALAEQEQALARFEQLGGLNYAGKIRELLARFGFSEADYALPTATLSGGQKKLVALARLAAESPELLMLDEPDNHLDLAAKRALEGFIRGYQGAVIIVSHDRYLLDEVVTHIAELEDGRLTLYRGSYSRYAIERELARIRQQQLYIAQQKRITQIEEAIKRFEESARIFIDNRSFKQARSRRKMLEKLEASGDIIEAVRERRVMPLQLNGWRGSEKALELKRLAMGFDDDLLFCDVSLLVKHGERVGLVGGNGAGKSVLFSLILGYNTPLDGEVKIAPGVKLGYYAQEHQTLANWMDRTPVEFIRDVNPSGEGEAVAKLIKFLFKYEQTRLPIRGLSGGERSRLQLLALMLTNPNLLLLDEPTNNLDIESAEALEGALDDFEGSLLVISHDRYFLERVTDRVVELREDGLHTYRVE
jgi:ATP-binding cassette subfamily F protein 3